MRIAPMMRPRFFELMLCSTLSALLWSCGREVEPPSAQREALATSSIQHVFVIAMENRDTSEIYGSANAPYINGTLMKQYAKSSNWQDELPNLVSEPHYLWMEAGTNAFSDTTFTTDNDPSSSNSTGSAQHLVAQIKNAANGVSWLTYQEDINSTTGACPIASSINYAAKHNPFVFFRDISGSPPSKSNAYCASHTKALTALASDLANDRVASYNFITPNLCHDMHGAFLCSNWNFVQAGDDWLKANLPSLIAYANSHQGVIFVTWDEGNTSTTIPFLIIGPHVKAGYTSTIRYDHSSMLKSIEEILQLPILPAVSSATNLADFFEAGFYP